MTEYEIADLAISRSMELQGLGALLMSQIESSGDIIQQFMTVLFAYLIAGYLIGASLSRIQVIIFTTLYTLWQLWTLGSFSVRGMGIQLTLEGISALRHSLNDKVPDHTYVPSSMFTTIQFTLLAAALAASLYFMWEVRRSKKT